MSLKNAVGGVGLLAGTAIGAAILALPVATAHLGFIYTVMLYLICWFFMTVGALYLLEANLFTGYGTNLISMAEKTLGNGGKVFSLFTYLILLYALTAAYLSGAYAWLTQALHYFNVNVEPVYCAVATTLLTMIVIFMGTFVTDWVNRLLMIGLLGTFGALLFASVEHIQLDLLLSQSFVWDIRPFPLTITAFGSAIVIPTITDYLHGKPKQLLWVVLIGSVIPLLVYICWEMCITGTIPASGAEGLIAIQQSGHPATDVTLALEKRIGDPWITATSTYFSIFALITSLLGVTLSLFDFLADGLRIKKSVSGKLILSFIAFLPPLLVVIFYPKGYSTTLSFAGIFASLLLGILPALIVWRGRYSFNFPSPLRILGGKPLLLITMLFFTCVICVELVSECNTLLGRFCP